MKRLNEKRFTAWQVMIMPVMAFLGIAVIGYAVTIPNTFTSGTTISSSEVNANFQALAGAIDNMKPARRVVVAAGGGDYTGIQAALDAITPTAANPYVIDVMPGTYVENITLKDYVHLRGAGREVTIIRSPSTSYDVITLFHHTHVAVSGLTITGGGFGIYNEESSPTISGNTIAGNSSDGIFNNYAPSATITGNTITGNGYYGISNVRSSPAIQGNTIEGNTAAGIWIYSFSRAVIEGNTITANGFEGILNESAEPTISGNTIARNGRNGILVSGSPSPVITHNRITDNGGTAYTDIRVDAASSPNISFNVYDDIAGITGVGLYNVKSDGSPAPAP